MPREKKIRIGLGNHPDCFVTETEFKALVKEAAEAEAERKARAEQEALCDAGLCDHYTCTEGWALAEWEFNRRANGLDY